MNNRKPALLETYEQALEKAYDLLSHRSYSSSELSAKLTERGAGGDLTEKVLNRLRELRFIDDEQYAQDVIRTYTARGYGENRIKNEFYRRGITEYSYLIGIGGENDVVASILTLIAKKYPRSDTSSPQGRKKLAAALSRRGFSFSDISEAIRRMRACESGLEAYCDDTDNDADEADEADGI